MNQLKTKLAVLIFLAGLVGATFISIQTTFLVLLTGLLVIPPVLVMASAIREGVYIIAEKLRRFIEIKNDDTDQVILRSF